MSNPNDASVRLNEVEMTYLMRLFEAITVSQLFDMLSAKLGPNLRDDTARGLVTLAGKVRASLDAAKAI